jgi:hypothetical protein
MYTSNSSERVAEKLCIICIAAADHKHTAFAGCAAERCCAAAMLLLVRQWQRVHQCNREQPMRALPRFLCAGLHLGYDLGKGAGACELLLPQGEDILHGVCHEALQAFSCCSAVCCIYQGVLMLLIQGQYADSASRSTAVRIWLSCFFWSSGPACN